MATAAAPLSPADEQATFRLADPNLTIELVAAEPDVRAPVAIAWDADGRMFVAEMTDYPSGPVNGRIRMLEDRDGDGRCERSIIFATNLAYPNGVMAWRNGILVTAAPDIWFLADTNSDGMADVREKILIGFVEGNQQLRVNGLFWGIDNWIYGANGRSDGEVKWADGTPAGSIRRHDFRFRPDTKQFEVVAGNSQFGMGHDDWGNRFPVFNATPIRHVVIEDRYLARQSSLVGSDNVPGISPTNDGNRVFALTPPTLLIPQAIGFFTSACGPSIYRGTALPDAYRGSYFVCEPVQNVVQRRVLQGKGSTFVAEYADGAREFLASTDRWFHGVYTATGPDGALYIVDFYRDLVEHPQWVAPELRDKVDWRKGEEHGRIWRVRAKNAKMSAISKLARVSNAELVGALESGNGWTRDMAHRLLVERQARDAVPALEKLARKGATAATRLQTLNVLDGLGATGTALLSSALRDSDPRVREHALRLSESRVDGFLSTLTKMAKDSDARVRLQLASSLGALADVEQRLDLLAQLARHAQLDEWQSLAIVSSAGPRAWPLVSRLQPLLDGDGPQLDLLARLGSMTAARTNSEDLAHILHWLKDAPSPNRFVVVASVLDATPGKLKLEHARLFLAEASLKVARDSKIGDRARVGAIRAIAARQEAGTLVELLDSQQSDAVQQAAATALLEANNDELARLAFSRWSQCSKGTRRKMIAVSPRQTHATMALLEAVERGAIPLVEIDPATRQSVEKSSVAEVKERAVKLFAATTSADRDAVVAKYRPALKMAADRANGARVFERNCTVCHQMQGVGAKVGPDLSGTGQQPRETLLVQILDPSRQVLPDFVSYTAETKSGESYSGFIAAESPASVTLRRANEPDITLKRSDLKEFQTSGKSLMPDGLEAAMSEQDVADLIEFLRRPDRTLFSPP
jgi:putative membrane-bound dehydrogenase-like protein